MRLLLDTHIFIWWDRQLRRVPPDVRSAIEDSANEIVVSAASVWEIAIKRASGKLAFAAPVVETIDRLGFDLLPISGTHAEHAGRLPRHHGDPFDRMLIAQSMLEGLVLGTRDAAVRPYGIPTLGLD